MHDPLDNPGFAAAKKICGDPPGQKSMAGPAPEQQIPVRPELLKAGAYVFLRPQSGRVRDSGRFDLPPTAPTLAIGPGRRIAMP